MNYTMMHGLTNLKICVTLHLVGYILDNSYDARTRKR